MRAQPGDVLTVRRLRGDEDRHGTILEVVGIDGAPPYLIRWQDGHESTYFPSSDNQIEHPHPQPDGVR